MASGSTAPFSGEFVDLENVPKLPEGISAEQILEQNSDVVRQVAEARFKSGLSQINADGGFFDAYFDESKISSKQGDAAVQTGISGKVELSQSEKINPSSPTSTGIISRNEGFEINPNREVFQLEVTLSSNVSNVSRVGISDASGTILDSKTRNFSSGETVKFSGISLGSGNNFYIFGDNQGSNFETAFGGQSSDINGNIVDYEGGAANILSGSPKTDTVLRVFQNFKVFGTGTSGTIIEQQFTFTDTQGNAFSPSKVGIFPEQNLNGQSISYDLKDSTGTVVKTFNQSDLNQLQSVNTTDNTFQVEANLSGNGSQTPELEFLDVRGV